ncbi:hypothetical protein HZB60_04100 [candidate division KSB1 bacterium]|nr:hypothetical protein [candidate division KSB1 bacterium]
MNTLPLKIEYLLTLAGHAVSETTFSKDVQIMDDGGGLYVAGWDDAKLGPRPTDAASAALDTDPGFIVWRLAGLYAEIKAGWKAEGLRRFEKKWGQNKVQQAAVQRANPALALLSAAELAAVEADIQAGVDAYNTAKTALAAALSANDEAAMLAAPAPAYPLSA